MTDHSLPTILLVEDEASDAALLLRGFAKAGVLNPIVHLRNGDDALAYLAGVGQYTNRTMYPLPVLILLDLKLPGMTGLQLLQWLRTQKEIRRIPVVVLTIERDSNTVNAAYDLGANSYLVKPGEPAEINRIVQAIQQYWIELNEPHLWLCRLSTIRTSSLSKGRSGYPRFVVHSVTGVSLGTCIRTGTRHTQ